MTPKTKYHKNIALIMGQLKPVSHAKIKWGIKRVFDSYCFLSRKTCFCLDCGYSWKNEVHEKSCPSCKVKLKPYENKKIYDDNAYYTVIDTFKNYQVIRHLFLTKVMKKNMPCEIFVHEVIQHWIDENGRLTSFAKPVHGFGMYFDSWRFHEPMTLQSNHFNYSPRYSLCGVIYPKKNILPILIRNGFSGNFYKHLPQDVFSVLLSSPKAETLLKANQLALFSQFIQDSGRKSSKVEKYWNTIKICLRNGYVIDSAHDYLDYLDLLEYFGKDLLNKKYACPNDLHSVHNKLVSKKREIQKRERIEEQKKRIEEENSEYIERMKNFFDLSFKTKGIEISVLKSVYEFAEIGDKLGHCIYTNEYYKKKISLLFKASQEDEIIETLELDLREMRIVQSRGFKNEPTQFSDTIRAIVNENIPAIQSRIKIAG